MILDYMLNWARIHRVFMSQSASRAPQAVHRRLCKSQFFEDLIVHEPETLAQPCSD